jgi:serine/threonine protein kinase
MHYLHIVHRDIKPANCLYSPAMKRYVLADFGVSHPVMETS